MIYNNDYFADILRVCEINDLIWVKRFQSPLVYIQFYAEIFCVSKPMNKAPFGTVSLIIGENANG